MESRYAPEAELETTSAIKYDVDEKDKMVKDLLPVARSAVGSRTQRTFLIV